jgi:phthiodiolone/phenolphthiodiolone dimycocerosates ketoreductase
MLDRCSECRDQPGAIASIVAVLPRRLASLGYRPRMLLDRRSQLLGLLSNGLPQGPCLVSFRFDRLAPGSDRLLALGQARERCAMGGDQLAADCPEFADLARQLRDLFHPAHDRLAQEQPSQLRTSFRMVFAPAKELRRFPTTIGQCLLGQWTRKPVPLRAVGAPAHRNARSLSHRGSAISPSLRLLVDHSPQAYWKQGETMKDARLALALVVPAQPPLASVLGLVRLARLLRFDAVMVWDHLQDFVPRVLWSPRTTWIARLRRSPHPYYDFASLLGRLSAHAGRLRLGVGVTDPIRRHPVLLAQTALTLAHLTRRPPIIGIGAGEAENLEPYGFPFDRPVTRLEEALAILRACLDTPGTIRFAGRFYQITDGVFELTAPPRRRPEIWLGAHGPRMLELTGRFADGWYPNWIDSPERYAARLAQVRQAAKRAGRDPTQIVPALQAPVLLAPTENAARHLLHHPALRLTGLLRPADEWRELGLEHPLGEHFRGYLDFIPERVDPHALRAALRAVPPELVERSFLWGTPEQVLARIRDYREAGLRFLGLLPVSALASPQVAAWTVFALWRLRRSLARELTER